MKIIYNRFIIILLSTCGVHVLVTGTVLYILNHSEAKSNFHHHTSYNCLPLSPCEVHKFVTMTGLNILNNADPKSTDFQQPIYYNWHISSPKGVHIIGTVTAQNILNFR